ncbi:MAG: hypothetical protein GY778_25175 [bacterium]|nr:hypothetical protein [bacterium]
MTASATDQLADRADALRQAAAQALNTETAEEFGQFERQLNRLDALVRETQQALWTDEADTAIEHLESGQPLTESDQKVIRTFLISDAEHYLAVENNYADWIAEFQRLIDEIGDRASTADHGTIGELRGLLKDAIRLVPDIRNYLEERQRVERCRMALHTFDAASRSALVRVLREQLERPNR